ncbi:prepilin-type N-terminal cleavage/methylation domain-containing protein [Chitinibacter fontanus]|uniref:Prepilin-type N-terminal cleavage/methylation domain-containing protein n=1 Tax=Chitinibacter fontanus TaxID=1737446 RepID=A0A7D5Z929_9NEIS|nr:prepilin-type N-terminal cleavage/methylation domain-containing protein [Chitinibacter fontanus]QLI80186.1 prepilin-type N-terminal cleavage/methylation domain-containing protein [Chitinibacter fontanus]
MNKKQLGFTLIEVLIALALGLLIIGGAFSYFLSTLKTSKDLLGQSKLQQEVRSTANLIQRDVRRAGYAPVGNPNEAVVRTIWLGKTDGSLADSNCFIYRYVDERGNLRNSGFLLHTDGKIYMKTTGNGNTCSASSTDWSAVTSASNVQYTEFKVGYQAGNRPSILLDIKGQLSSDTNVKLPLSIRVVMPNSPLKGDATNGA